MTIKTLILLIIAPFFIFGCRCENLHFTNAVDAYRSAQMVKPIDPNNKNPIMDTAASIIPPIGISIWSDRYHAQFHQYPDSKEKLRAFVDAHPKLGPTILWDNIEDFSISSTDNKRLFMKGTMILGNSNGNHPRLPFTYSWSSDPNNISPQMKLNFKEIVSDPNDVSPETKTRIAEQLKDILKK